MTTRLHFFLLLFILVLFGASANAATPAYLYQTKLIQAAPGKLLDVIELQKSRMAEYKNIGEDQPFMMRHSQGDRWDLLLLIPMKSYVDYYNPDRVSKRNQTLKESQDKLDAMIAWQEDVFVYGPPLAELQKAFASSAFFHVEMFDALAGKQSELFREREMENAYLKALKRPENLIFVRDQGGSCDLFTIGAYRDLKHFAESADIPEADQEAAAKAAGFEAANRIGPYLRTLISLHHDTLAVTVK